MEELTRVVLVQEKELQKLTKEVEQLKTVVKELSVSAVAPESEETPPPHY
jgi:SlyX protein